MVLMVGVSIWNVVQCWGELEKCSLVVGAINIVLIEVRKKVLKFNYYRNILTVSDDL